MRKRKKKTTLAMDFFGID